MAHRDQDSGQFRATPARFAGRLTTPAPGESRTAPTEINHLGEAAPPVGHDFLNPGRRIGTPAPDYGLQSGVPSCPAPNLAETRPEVLEVGGGFGGDRFTGSLSTPLSPDAAQAFDRGPLPADGRPAPSSGPSHDPDAVPAAPRPDSWADRVLGRLRNRSR